MTDRFYNNRLHSIVVIFGAAIWFSCLLPLHAQAKDSLTIKYNYINTSPQNANIYLNDILIGQSPLFFMWDSNSVNRKITIKLEGYSSIEYTSPGDEVFVNKSFKLIPLPGYKTKDLVFKDKSFAFHKPFKFVPIIISSVVTAGSAIMAYYFKSLAIEKSDEYNLTGDPALLDKKKKYDLIGGISIAVFQAGLCALIYYHFIE
ncbi:MAG TPA: PEGA domain-containing protein [Ignavibacteria bacterium]|nr:PEGA domain-containing protein [Ignavibacteria bacterium]